ncbi:MAG: TorF family putative porin [Campylobacterota bacterium]|nr:TorF family putative porin [Campylobacterota bacterium]
MKLKKMSLFVALSVSAVVIDGNAESIPAEVAPIAEEKSDLSVSANLAIASNYIWRGMSQSKDSPAVQGGVDIEYRGFYLGTWGSNVDFGVNDDNSLEADFYAGYKAELASIGFDIGIVQYAFPNALDAYNSKEAYLGISEDFDMFGLSAKYSWGLDDAPDDWNIGASVKLPIEIGLEGTYGDYETAGSYYVLAVTRSFGKFDFNVGYTDFTSDEDTTLDEDHIVASVSTSF